jgi:hypothetical protein
MNKTLFQYCQKHLRFINNGQLKVNASLKSLVNIYNIGYISNGFFHFNTKDKQHLIEVISQQLNGIRLSDEYPEQQSRIKIAATHRNEKVGSLNVSEDYVLLNSLDSLRLNNQVTQNISISSLGHFICASEIETIEHQQIVLVENLIIMANLDRLNIPDTLKEALWLYRGDAKAFNQTGTAYQLFRRFKLSHQLICFSDLDPSGLQICLTSGANQWLTLNDEKQLNIELKGNEQEWFNQNKAISYLNSYLSLPKTCERLFLRMKQSQTTLKQEHMLQHSLKLTLFPLKD